MANADIRLRVDRLLRGVRDPRDLERLFTWLRFRSFGQTLVKDIGDFSAHIEDRDRGVAWRGVGAIANQLAYQVPRIAALGGGARPPSTLSDLKASMQGALQTDTPVWVKAGLGMSKHKAGRLLDRVLGKTVAFDGTTVSTNGDFSPDEDKVFRRYTSTLVIQPAFTDDDLISELKLAMRKNGLVDEAQAGRIEGVKDEVALFAMEKMHLARIELPNGEVANLEISPAEPGGFLHVNASIRVQPTAEKHFFASVALFKTSVSVEQNCEGKLLETWLNEPRSIVREPLHITPAGKLAFLE